MITNKQCSPTTHRSSSKDPKKLSKEDSTLSKHHLLAKTHIDSKNYSKAISSLLTIIQTNPSYSTEIYFEIANCFIILNDYQTAARQLTRGLLNFPEFADGFLSRGLIHIKLQQWEKSISDFTEALKINKNLGSAYLGLADGLVGFGDVQNAIKVLESALKCPESYNSALLSRGKLFFSMQEFQKALRDFEQLIEIQVENAEAYYFKAFCLLGLENPFDAVVALEQVIKHDTQKQFTGAAIYNLGAIKIKQKDFYGAFYTFKRASDLGLDLPEQKVLQQYVEAILFLIKRNFAAGARVLTKIIKKKDKLLEEHIGNCLEYRAYAYAFMESHIKAVKDLQAAKKLQEIEKSSVFNLCVSEGILAEDLEISVERFDQAFEIFNNPEPVVYKAAIWFRESVKKGVKAVESKKLLDSALKMRENDSEMFFFRAVVLYYNNKTIEAIYDLEKAIDKAEENLPKQFLARGCCSARLKVYKEAIEDFSIVLQLDEKHPLAYLYRGRCFYLMDELEKAYEDFKEASEIRPSLAQDFLVFLLYAGSYSEALKVAETLFNKTPSVEAIQSKVFCLIFLEKIDLVIKELKRCCTVSGHIPNSSKKTSELEVDLEIFQSLKDLSTGPEKIPNFLNRIQNLTSKTGSIIQDLHIKWLSGVAHMYQHNFSKARQYFESVLTKPNKRAKSMERNTAELIYNLSLCYYLEGNFFDGLFHLLDICNFLQDDDKGKVFLLIALTKSVLNNEKEAEMFLTEANKLDPEIVQSYTEGETEIKLQPLDCDSELLKNFPFFSLEIANVQILVKPSVSLPRPTLKNFEFEMENEILELFTVKSVKCKPETPYLNRVGGMIQFTEVIQELSGDSDSERDFVSSDSGVFSNNSLCGKKYLEIPGKTVSLNKNSEDCDSSLSGILDEIEG